MVAINVALEAPEFVCKVIADSFEGEKANASFTRNLLTDRENAKKDRNAQGFYEYMHGNDWESIVDNDTDAIVRHQKEIVDFFHRPIDELKADILLTGSREDKFMYSISEDYYEKAYDDILAKLPKGKMYLFSHGDHPAMMSCFGEFYPLSMEFLLKE